MAGTFKEESYMARIDGKNAVRFRDTVVVGNGELYSFARIDSQFWAILQVPGHHTAILLDRFGFGSVPCSINDLSAYEMGEEFLRGATVSNAVSLCDLDADDMVKEEIIESLIHALKKMYSNIGNRSPLFDVSDEDFEVMFFNALGTLEQYQSAM
jgi:hypothetical protein